ALVDVDGLVAAGGGHNVRGAVVVVPVRREPHLHPVLPGGRDVDPIPGGVARLHRGRVPHIRPVLPGQAERTPVAAGAEPTRRIVHSDRPAGRWGGAG